MSSEVLHPGQRYHKPSGTPGDYWNLIGDNELVNTLVLETNRHGQAAQAAKDAEAGENKSSNPSERWTDTSAEELQAFIGVLIIMGINMRQDRDLYWSKDEYLGCEAIQKVFPRDRFQALITHLHAADDAADDGEDFYFKIRGVMDRILENSRKLWNAYPNLALDERIAAFKGRSRAKVYIKNKPTKWGFKLHVLSDEKHFVLAIHPYAPPPVPPAGQKPKKRPNLTLETIQDLTQPFAGRWHRVYMDNYYTSLPAFDWLYEHQIYATGTAQLGKRDGMPKDLHKFAEDSNLQRGNWAHRYRTAPPTPSGAPSMIAVAWQDSKPVYLLSTQHSHAGVEKVKRWTNKGANASRKEILHPDVHRDYQRHMQHVDR